MFDLDNVIDTNAIETASKPETVRAGGTKRSQAQAFLNQGGHAGFWRKAAQAWVADDTAPCMFIPAPALEPVLMAAVKMIDAEWPTLEHGDKPASQAMKTWYDAEQAEPGKGINALLGQLNGYRPEGFNVLSLRAFRHDNGKIGIVIHEQSKRTQKLRERLGISENASDKEVDAAIAKAAEIEWSLLGEYASGKRDATPHKVTDTSNVKVRENGASESK